MLGGFILNCISVVFVYVNFHPKLIRIMLFSLVNYDFCGILSSQKVIVDQELTSMGFVMFHDPADCIYSFMEPLLEHLLSILYIRMVLWCWLTDLKARNLLLASDIQA